MSNRAFRYFCSAPGVSPGKHRRPRLPTLSDELAFHAVKNRYLAIIKNDSALAFLRDLPFILARDAMLWTYLVLRRPRVGWRVLRDGAHRRRAWGRRRRLAAWRESARRGVRELTA